MRFSFSHNINMSRIQASLLQFISLNFFYEYIFSLTSGRGMIGTKFLLWLKISMQLYKWKVPFS